PTSRLCLRPFISSTMQGGNDRSAVPRHLVGTGRRDVQRALFGYHHADSAGAATSRPTSGLERLFRFGRRSTCTSTKSREHVDITTPEITWIPVLNRTRASAS